jgi:hypothetical protein
MIWPCTFEISQSLCSFEMTGRNSTVYGMSDDVY